MRLQEHIDFTTLQWVKPELEATFAIARRELEAHVETPTQSGPMQACIRSLHQIRGTLRMVELYGAALVAAEMEALAESLLSGQPAQRDEAYAVLMRGLMQLPDYLERLSSGHRDVPVVLLPLLNDLRASRGEAALPESALFTPPLDMPLPEGAPGVVGDASAEQRRVAVAELRLRFQQQLLSWFRGQGGPRQLAVMRETLDAIAAQCHSVPGRRLWWIAAGVLEGLEQGALKDQANEVRQLIGKVDRSIRQLIEQGEESLADGDATELSRKLLYLVAQTRQGTPRLELLRRTYRLDGLLPDPAELEHARGSMAGHNRALLDSVAKALKDDLLRVKEALDMFLRRPDGDLSRLGAQLELLERVGDTLGMLALAVPRRVVNQQRRVLEEIAHGLRKPDEEALLDVAAALLYVEASLDDHIERLGAGEDERDEGAPPSLPRSEARQILATLMHEATANTGLVKEAIVAFVESAWEHPRLAPVPALMNEVAGALRMLSAPRPAALADGIGRFVGNELLGERKVPDSAQMDKLADALAALEYYLEAARDHRGGLEHILDVAQLSLAALGYWPVPPARYPAEDDGAVDELAPASAAELSESVSLAPGDDSRVLFVDPAALHPSRERQHDLAGLRLAQTEPVAPTVGEPSVTPATSAVHASTDVLDPRLAEPGFRRDNEGIDEEIRAIFLEEVQEEIEQLQAAQPAWLAAPSQPAALAPLRRAFHTLKGSGRLVGASLLGEFAWQLESLLNRVLEQSVAPHEGVREVVGRAIDALPALKQALLDGRPPAAPVLAIMDAAERLASGDELARIEDYPVDEAAHAAPLPTAVLEAVPTASLSRETPASRALAADADVLAAFADEPAALSLPALPPVDAVLLEILRSEVAQYLQTIRAVLLRHRGDELRVDESLLRAVHTLHGAIAMVDIPVLIQVLSPLESLLKRLRGAGQPLSAEGVGLLAHAADAVDQVMAQFDAEQPELPQLDDLVARLTELRDAQPEPSIAHHLFEPHADEYEDAAHGVDAIDAELRRDDLASQLSEALDAFHREGGRAASEAEVARQREGASIEASLAALAATLPQLGPVASALADAATPTASAIVDGTQQLPSADGGQVASEASAFTPATDDAAEVAAATADAFADAAPVSTSVDDGPYWDVDDGALQRSLAQLPDVTIGSGHADEAAAELAPTIGNEPDDEARESASTDRHGPVGNESIDTIDLSSSVAPPAIAKVATDESDPLSAGGNVIGEADGVPEEDVKTSEDQITPGETGAAEAGDFSLYDEPGIEASSSPAAAQATAETLPAAALDDATSNDAAIELAAIERAAEREFEAASEPLEGTLADQLAVPVEDETRRDDEHAFVVDGAAAEASPRDIADEADRAGKRDSLSADTDTDTDADARDDLDVAESRVAAEPTSASEPSAGVWSEPSSVEPDGADPTGADRGHHHVVDDSAPAARTSLAADSAKIAETAQEGGDSAVSAASEAKADSAASSAAESPFAQIDPDLLEIFIEEAREILDHADGELAAWRDQPGERKQLASLQRDLHTLKGGARIAGLRPVGDLSHALETLLDKLAGGELSYEGATVEALEAGFDHLHALVQRVAQAQPIEQPITMIARLLALSGGSVESEAGGGFVAPERLVNALPSVASAQSSPLLPELLPESFDEGRASQEQIRVRADLLDTLVNHAGEVAIYRSRLEQQVAGYRFNLVELEQTVSRLRSQLRAMEIETEAQIIARFQREHREAGLTAFDPLELDRYSQLQQYSRALAESVSDLVSLQGALDELTRQAEGLLIQQSRVSSELQDGLLRTRMLPFDTMVPNLRRTLRQAGHDLGKQAQLHVDGAHGEMDRNLLDRIKAPFEHMLRNAVAHGIETPAQRRAAGKPEQGEVRIQVAREATEVVIRVSDDGRGLDRVAIRSRAIERGLLRNDARISDEQLLTLITQPGFSTASELTQLAGRGLGMDVVANEIKQLGGALSVQSTPGQGTTFVLRLPFTLAVTQAILVRIGESNFAIPMTSVQGVARISPDELASRLGELEPRFEHGGEFYDIHSLAELLGLPPLQAGDEAQLPLLLTRSGELRAAIRIDAVIGSREIVVKSVGPQISSVPGILGATIMGDGSVLVILDLAPLVRHGMARRRQRLEDGLPAVSVAVLDETRQRPLVMVVDDSITMRKVTGRVLERHEFDVLTAKDGIDALEKLTERVPDLILLDIEMPRMDGYELAAHLQGDPRLAAVPIIMITSRTGEKHRQRAFDLGVRGYLGKPYQEAELVAQIDDMLDLPPRERSHD